MSIPEEIKQALSALSHSIRWQIIELIQEHESLSYTELLQRLGIRKGSLTYHLDRLMETGILDNYSGEEFGGPYASYYQLSSFGKDLIAGILTSIEVPLLPQKLEKPQELQIFDLSTHEMQKEFKNDYIDEKISSSKIDFNEVNEPAVFNIVSGRTIMDKMRGKSILWLQRDLKLSLKSVKTDE